MHWHDQAVDMNKLPTKEIEMCFLSPINPLIVGIFFYQQYNLNYLLGASSLKYSRMAACVYLINMKCILENCLFTADNQGQSDIIN